MTDHDEEFLAAINRELAAQIREALARASAGGAVTQCAIVCDCTGAAVKLATLTDRRAAGGDLSITSARDQENTQQAIFGTADGPEHARRYGNIARSWAERVVTETVWGDGHSTWIIRCQGCGRQVQIHGDALARLADGMAAGAGRHEFTIAALSRAFGAT